MSFHATELASPVEGFEDTFLGARHVRADAHRGELDFVIFGKSVSLQDAI